MSETIILSPQTMLDTPNISLQRDDSSINIPSTTGESEMSCSTHNDSFTSSNYSAHKISKIEEKDIDHLNEKLKVLQTRLDFKLTIANVSKLGLKKNKTNLSCENLHAKILPLKTNYQENLSCQNTCCREIPLIDEKYQNVLSILNSNTKIDFLPEKHQIFDEEEELKKFKIDELKNLQQNDSDDSRKFEGYIWTGILPNKIHKNPKYSNKVFLGGIPWDMTEQGLFTCFKQFGVCNFEWPGKDSENGRHPPKGYVYVIFENERSVKNLLFNCVQDFTESNGEHYLKITTNKTQTKNVQVIPWIISDSSYLTSFTERLDTSKTIFVGGLHGMMTAEILAKIFNEMFSGVIYAGIDTDKHKYPIGSGRITFSNYTSYAKAIQSRFVEIRTPKFVKKVQIDPYLEESFCSECKKKQGPFFCRDFSCFKYYCNDCWHWAHHSSGLKNHRPVTRQARQNIPVDLSFFSRPQVQSKI